MIDEKKLLEELHEIIRDIPNIETYVYGYHALEKIEELINKQPKVGNDIHVGTKWIPCSERLPDKEGSYLTTTEYGAVRVNHYYHKTKEWGYHCNKTVAWQPLPEPF